MSNSLSDAFPQPQTFTIGQLTITVSKPTIKSIAGFEGWCKAQIRENAKKFCTEVPEDSARAAILQEATREANRCTFRSQICQGMLESGEGMIAFIRECMTPESKKQVTQANLMDAAQNQDELLAIVAALTGDVPENPQAGTQGQAKTMRSTGA